MDIDELNKLKKEISKKVETGKLINSNETLDLFLIEYLLENSGEEESEEIK